MSSKALANIFRLPETQSAQSAILQGRIDANKSSEMFSFRRILALGFHSATLPTNIFNGNSCGTGDEIESQQANIQGKSFWLPMS